MTKVIKDSVGATIKVGDHIAYASTTWNKRAHLTFYTVASVDPVLRGSPVWFSQLVANPHRGRQLKPENALVLDGTTVSRLLVMKHRQETT